MEQKRTVYKCVMCKDMKSNTRLCDGVSVCYDCIKSN